MIKEDMICQLSGMNVLRNWRVKVSWISMKDGVQVRFEAGWRASILHHILRIPDYILGTKPYWLETALSGLEKLQFVNTGGLNKNSGL